MMLPISVVATFIAAILAGCVAGGRGGVAAAFSTFATCRRTHNLASMQLSTSDTTAGGGGGKRTTSEELIPREILFGNPENTSPLLSPDGSHLAYLAPSPDGVMNIFIRSLLDVDKTTTTTTDEVRKDRMITNEPKRAIRSLAWAYDSSTILYMQDNDGDENFHLFAVYNATATTPTSDNDDDSNNSIPQARDLTPGKNVKAQNIFTNYRYPNEIMVGTNQRNSKCFDMYR